MTEMNRFLIALDSGSREEQNAITFYLTGRGWQLWHWMEDLWLLANVPKSVRPKALWEELARLPGLSTRRMLVLCVDDPKKYWGNITQEAWPWMKQNWGALDSDPPGTRT